MGFESEKLGGIENEDQPRIQTVEVDFMRHGESTYKERHSEERESDLTELGKQQVVEQANKLASSIDKANEVVILWASPAWRTQDSVELIKEVFRKEGIEIARESTIPLMRQIRENDLEYMDGVWQKAKDEGINGDLIVTRDPEFQKTSDKFESYPEIQQRARGVYNWVHHIAEKVDTKGKKLRIIGVGHMESLEPIMETLFDYDIEQGEGIKKGEAMKVTFNFDRSTKKMSIAADFRGQHKEGIAYDKKQRVFVTDHESVEPN